MLAVYNSVMLQIKSNRISKEESLGTTSYRNIITLGLGRHALFSTGEL